MASRGKKLSAKAKLSVGEASRKMWASKTPEEMAVINAKRAASHRGKKFTAEHKAKLVRARALVNLDPPEAACKSCNARYKPRAVGAYYCDECSPLVAARVAVAARDKTRWCEICGKISTLQIDHDHTDGYVRGFLCNNCNHGLGSFQDDVATLQRAIAYLTAHTWLSPRPLGVPGATRPIKYASTGLTHRKRTE